MFNQNLVISTATFLSTNSTFTVKHLEELTLQERCIREYILELDRQNDDCKIDAIFFADGPELMLTPCAFEDGELMQADFCPQFWDAEAINRGPAGVYAINQFANDEWPSGTFAIDADDSERLLFYPKN